MERKYHPRDRAPYGPALAAQVAAQLLRGHALGYRHRDFCGLGLDYRDGCFRYGELQDGDLEPELEFPDPAAFVAWLAAQSNRSLARLEKDAWHQDNQTITRQRLEDFIGSAQPLSGPTPPACPA